MSIETDIQQFRDAYQKLKAEISKVIVGHEPIIDGTLVAIFSGGHVLLEGVPGLGGPVGADAESGAESVLQSRPVHSRSHARRYRGHQSGGREFGGWQGL